MYTHAIRSVIVALGLALALVGAGAATARAEVKPGDRAPELDGARDERGKAFKLKAYRGKWVVMTFGGSWCKPCKKELPAWDRLAGKWAGKVVFIAVNLDNDKAKGKKFMDGLKVRKMLRAYGPRRPPPPPTSTRRPSSPRPTSSIPRASCATCTPATRAATRPSSTACSAGWSSSGRGLARAA